MFLTERTLGAKVLSHNGFGNLREVKGISGKSIELKELGLGKGAGMRKERSGYTR